MKLFIVVSLLATVVAGGSVDMRDVLPRHFDTRLPLVPYGRLPIDGRITNGETAIAKQLPFQAGLLLVFSDGSYWCGGTLISNRWILTAGHCTFGVQTIQVILGGLRSSPNGDEGEEIQVIEANENNVIVHAGYDDWTLENDISLIQLADPVTFTDYIKAAKLPVFTGTAPLYTGDTAVASGWGLVSDSSSTISPTLQWADVVVITNAKCSVSYGKLASSVLCVSTEGTKKSTCSGDSGGPLVKEGTDTLIGVTSFGVVYGCELEWPTGFSRVTSFLSWIEEKSGVTP